MTTRKKLLAGKMIAIIICLLITVGILCIFVPMRVHASNLQTGASRTPELSIGKDLLSISYDDGNGQINGTLKILLTLTFISLVPMLIILMTSFTRIIIVLHFTRSALNTQTAPPNQILIGLALILTFFIMEPTFTQIYNDAFVPFDEGRITQEEALEKGIAPMRNFMYDQTQVKDVDLFMEIADLEWDNTLDNIPTSVLVPSFIIGELRRAFLMGFIIYIPFIVIDMVVASTLMSMGMMMLPPTTISMPFKILLFVLADGWALIISILVQTFR